MNDSIGNSTGNPSNGNTKKPLRRSRGDRMIAGVMGGLGKHYDIDPVKLRVAYVLVSIFSAAFPGIIVYLVMWLLIPLDDEAR